MELKEYLKTTPKYIQLLAANGITTIRDFFLYVPRAYEDRKNIVFLSALQSEQIQYTVKVQVQKVVITKTAKGRKIITYQVLDEEGTKATVNFFYAPYILSQFKTGEWYLIIGKPKNNARAIAFRHPEHIPTEGPDIDVADINGSDANVQDSYQVNRIYPVYPTLQGIRSSRFAKKIWEQRHLIPSLFGEYLPETVLADVGIMDFSKTMYHIHYPDSMEDAHAAQRRLSFDALLRVQLSSLMQKHAYQEGKTFYEKKDVSWDEIKTIVDALPFVLTQAQKKCVKTIIENIHESHPMLRLLQGDVGSGKTVVAAIAAYYVVKYFGAQVAFLAPLEVLAHQHYKTIAKILLPLGVRVGCITGSTSAGEKKDIKRALELGHLDVIIGTHALLQESVTFRHLFLVVIDEQHKFGVRQRGFFKKFGSPHILQMTATPIPRSMALAFFGEFTVSTIDQMPAGRKPITTKIISASEFKKLKQWVLTKLSQNQRLFIVTPLIEESEILQEVKSAMQEYAETIALYKELEGKVGLLHGKMKPAEKQETMEKFKKGEYMILVSTTVIEVGIDVPEATIMIIKNADRFGLAQLHQLRGRVGRSDVQSYCFLETTYRSGEAYHRLRAMEQYTDGFALAELDLQYRGAGEFLGTRQSGITDIPYEMMADTAFLEKVQYTAKTLLDMYPGLGGIEHLRVSLDSLEKDLLV